MNEEYAISVTVITLNEERNIEECLRSCSWADEIVVVVDSRSTDRTLELARQFTDKVFVEEWKGQGALKNVAVHKASKPWIFSIDADERVTPKLADEIRTTVLNPRHNAYALKRKNLYRGKWIKRGGWWPDKVKRLFKKDTANFNDAVIHDAIQVDGSVGELINPLIHYPRRSAIDFAERAVRYSEATAREKFEQGQTIGWAGAIGHTVFAFIDAYIRRGGVLDGGEGFLVAFSNAAGVLYRYALLRELVEDKRNLVKMR
jgi:glycosyltransferase involved in cell wall biosynthesis